MDPILDIQYAKSLARGRLCVRSFWEELPDSLVFYLFACGLVVYPVLAYQAIDWNSVNERPLGYFGYPLLIAAGLLLFCWKYREKRLVRVRTKLDKRQSRAAVVRFLQQDGFAIIRNNKDFVVAVSDEGAFEWPRQLTVLFEDGCCHINVLTLGRDSRMPSFFKKREYVQQLKGVLSEAARVSSEPLH